MSEDLGVTTGGDVLTHVLSLGTNGGGDFTPDGIAAATEKLAAQIRKIDDELHVLIATQDADTAWVADWSTFVLAWDDWKQDHSSWISNAWNQTRDDLVNWDQQYEALRTRWLAFFPASQAVSFTVKAAPTSGNALADWGKQIGAALEHIAIGAGVLLGVGLAAYVTYRVAK